MIKSLVPLLALFSAYGETTCVDVFQAIRNDRLDILKQYLTKEKIETRDRRGATPLMHSAAYGSIAAMKLLLDAGAAVNARNAFDATALLWCARDPQKARLLIEHGADVNARSKQGRTPLMLASMRSGGSDIVALMLAKGADVKIQDSRGETALGLAAQAGDTASMRLLIAKGADVNVLNEKGQTPLILAAESREPEAIRMLLAKHVDVNAATTWYASVKNGQITLLQLTALHNAAGNGPAAMVRDLLKARANPDALDVRGFSPLTMAVASEYADPETVRALIDAGAAVSIRSKAGETPLDWAEKFGNPAIIAILKKAGAKNGDPFNPPAKPKADRPGAATALVRSVTLLQRSSAQFFTEGGCVGCHHQPLIARVQRFSKIASVPVNDALAREQLLQLKSQWTASQEEFLQSLNPGGGPNRLGENLLALHAAGYAPDTITDSAVVDLAEAQAADGTWPPGESGARPPITEGLIGSTARAIRALQEYSIPARKPEFDGRIARARAWLEHAVPLTTDDFAMRLSGLQLAGADPKLLAASAKQLIALQREDGGWSGNKYLTSDAFSTGYALTALYESGQARVTDPVYQRGIAYLLATQYPDGSWYVRSRAMKFQPYFESGFPFGHDQWISAAGTAWAAMAIAPAVSPSNAAAGSAR